MSYDTGMKLPTVCVLAAGENSRFFPLNTSTHKGALTLLGKPLVVRALENLEKNGFEDVVIIVSHKDYDGKGLCAFLSDYEFKKLKISYVLQPEPKGMGNALLCAKDHLHGNFGVIFPYYVDVGDTLFQLVQEAGNGGSIAVSYTQEPWLYGIVTLSGRKVVGIVEKPKRGSEPSNLKARGIYYLSHEYLAFLEKTESEEYSFESALDKYLQVFEVHAVEQIQSLPDLKYPWHLFDFQKLLFSSMPQYISPYAHIAKTVEMDISQGPIYIENGARIGHCVKLVGPVYIGKDVFIGDFSLIRSSSFEEGSSVGVHSDVTRSIVMEGSSMHNGFLGDSIIGRNVTIGAGLITSNKRMDRGAIDVVVKGQKISTGLTALGSIIGDSAKIGIRVNTMPGKFVGCRSLVYPGTTLWEHIPHDATVKQKQDIQIETKA